MVLLLKNGPVNVNINEDEGMCGEKCPVNVNVNIDINEDEGMCEENGPAAKKPVPCLLLL